MNIQKGKHTIIYHFNFISFRHYTLYHLRSKRLTSTLGNISSTLPVCPVSHSTRITCGLPFLILVRANRTYHTSVVCDIASVTNSTCNYNARNRLKVLDNILSLPSPFWASRCINLEVSPVWHIFYFTLMPNWNN